jgi:DNA/RNA endonuclease YhcR with UshA esterase domain
MIAANLIEDRLEASTKAGILKDFAMDRVSALPSISDSYRGHLKYLTTDDQLYLWRGTTLGWASLALTVGAYASEGYVDTHDASILAAAEAFATSIAQGFDAKASVRVATTTALPTNGLIGVPGGNVPGSVLHGTSVGALPAIDGVTLTVGDSILVKDEASALKNGIYVVSSLGGVSTHWDLTRRSDADVNVKVTAGMFCWVSEGTVNGDTAWFLTTDDPITTDVTGLSFSKFASLTSIPRSSIAAGTASHLVVNDGSGNLSSEATLGATRFPALTGDVTTPGGSLATTITGLARSKLAAGTASHLLINDGSGVVSSEATLGATRFPVLTGAVTTPGGSLATTLADDVVVNVKVAAAAAIARSKLASGTAAHLLINDGSGVMSSEATLGATRFPALTGDVTTAGGSLATTIANNAISYAKMQNVSATQRVLGRNTSGSGDTEEVTIAQLLAWIGSNPVTAERLIMSQSVLTYAATTDIDFDTADVRTITLTGNVTFTTSNKAAGKSKVLIITCDGTLRTFTFPAWISVGAALPASIAASKVAVLTLTCTGTTDALIIAAYAVQP